MEKRNLYIIVAVILVVGLALSFSNLTGNNIRFNSAIGQCVETDGGANPHNPGVVTYTKSTAVYKDTCSGTGGVGVKKIVRESFCYLGKLKTRKYVCENGCSITQEGLGFCNEGHAEPMNE